MGDSARKVPEIEVGDAGGSDVLEHGVDPADVGQWWVAELAEDADVDLPGRPNWADGRGIVTLEDGVVAGDAALDGLFEDDVSLVEATLGPGILVVVDLCGEGAALRDGAKRRWGTGERTHWRFGGRRGRSSLLLGLLG